jgi:hypothetical protein
MDFSTDEYFGTLGGSLMKDLLADLQVGEGDFSLEHLERELAQLDNEPPQVQPQQMAPLNAASLVVSHARERQGALANAVPVAAPAHSQGQGMDAWSLSLQNFTAMSLQDDFLAADSARKQQQAVPYNNPRVAGLDAAEDYDIGERPAMGGAPPGMPPGMAGMGAPPAASKPPNPRIFPKTPQNSLALQEEDASLLRHDIMQSIAESFKSAPGHLDTEPMALLNSIPAQQTLAPGDGPGLAPPAEVIPPQGLVANLPGPPESVIPPQRGAPDQAMPPPGEIPPQPNVPTTGPPPAGVYPAQAATFAAAAVPPGAAGPGGMPHGIAGVPRPVLLAVPAGGPAWQTAPTAPVPNAPTIFCNPHPSAPPIPGTALEAKFMTARDVTYVIHSILKPVLAEGVSEDDYHIQYMLRMGGPQANPRKPKHAPDMNKEMTSRENRSKEWSSEKGTLGYVSKSNVARPRALIATPQQTEQDSEHKQRASLWKARIYCDQAYQSFQKAVELWRSASSGGVPPEVQMHLAKLMKCMGIALVDKDCQIDAESLKLLVKLSKGQVLIARVLDLALLPPNAVQSLLPPLADALLGAASKIEDSSNDRLFRSMSNVVQKLNMSSDSLLNCLEVVQRNGKASLSSTARMEYVHILLRKGAFVVGQDPSQDKRAAWGKAESEFVALMQAL